MVELFEKELYAGWGEMDFNSHMANTAFLNKAADIRMMFFAHNGLSGITMAKMRVGPVIKAETLVYFREIGLMEKFRCSMELVGVSEDGSRFKIRNEFKKMDGILASSVTSTGGWLDLNTRKLITPNETMMKTMSKLQKTEDFEILPSSVKKI